MQQTGISSTALCSQMEAAGCLPLSLWLLRGTHVMKMETDYGQPDTQITNRDPGEKLVLLVLEGDSADLPSAHPHCAPQTWSQVELCSSTRVLGSDSKGSSASTQTLPAQEGISAHTSSAPRQFEE